MNITSTEEKAITVSFCAPEKEWKDILGVMRTWSPDRRNQLAWLFDAIADAVEPREQGTGIQVPEYHLHDTMEGPNIASTCVRCQVGLTDGPVYERVHR